MVHGADAVLPADVRFEAPRVVAYIEEASDEALEDAVDLLDEIGDIALARTAIYQQALRNYHSRRVRTRSFATIDLDRKSTRLNSSHSGESRMPSSA